jgi:hypothetical protein
VRNFFTRKVKYILLSIFLISIVTVSIWYFFFYRCNQLPEEFEFLEGFETVNQCDHKEYSVKGIIYNIVELEDSVIFDFNLWDTENYESLYYENISVPINTFQIPFDVTYDGFGAVQLSIEFTRDNSNFFSRYILGEYDIASMRLDGLTLSEEEVTRAIDVLYAAVTVSPFVEDTEYNIISNETLNAVITDVFHDEGQYIPSLSDGFTNRQLYRPWALSRLLEYQDEYEIEIEEQEIIDMLSFDLDQWFEDSVNEGEIECLDDECEYEVEDLELEELGEGSYELDISGYQYNNSLACLMIMQISESMDLEDSIYKKYCDYDYVDESIEDSGYKSNESITYTWDDYINSLNIDILRFNEEGRDKYLHSSNISSILLDSYSLNKIYGEDILRKAEEREDFVINYLLENDAPYLKNICLVNMYLSFLKRDGHSDENHDGVIEKVSLLFNPLNKDILELIEDDVYGASLCLDGGGFEGSLNYENLRDDLILKTLLINLYDDNQKRGIWINDEYDIRINARFLKSLLDYMEDSL